MIENIHVDPKLEKCLTVLERGGRRACLAADRVRSIIAELRQGEIPTHEICSFTKNGEARIKGCRKYDLGAGYRLVTLKRGIDLYLLYAGTHDECGRWVENNREQLAIEMIGQRSTTIKRPAANRASKADCKDLSNQEREEEEDWIPPLDDQDLRIIFKGLIQSVGDKSNQ